MSDNIKQQLMFQRNDYTSAASLYDCMIRSSVSFSTQKRIDEMKEHHQGILLQASHEDFKSKSDKCLSCVNVLNCKSKCDLG